MSDIYGEYFPLCKNCQKEKKHHMADDSCFFEPTKYVPTPLVFDGATWEIGAPLDYTPFVGSKYHPFPDQKKHQEKFQNTEHQQRFKTKVRR